MDVHLDITDDWDVYVLGRGPTICELKIKNKGLINAKIYGEAGRGVTPILEMPIFESTFYCNPSPIIFFMFSL